MFDVSASFDIGGTRAGFSSADVSAEIGAALSRGRRYGEYIILECDDKRRALKTEITDMNSDPRSDVFVTRSAYIKDGAFTVLSASLGADEDNADLCVPLTGELKKKSGEILTVSVTVSLSFTRDGATFAGGDNPLVEWLLGTRDLGKATVRMGKNRSPLGMAPPVSLDGSAERSASVELSESGVTFTSEGSGMPVEACLMIDGKAALRALPLASSARVMTGSLKCEANGKVMTYTEMSGVMSVIRDGTPVTDYTVLYGRSSVGAPVPSGIRVGRQPVMTFDGDFNRIAIVTDGEATLLKIVGREPACDGQKRIVGDKEKVRLARDGALFCYDGENLVLLSENGETKFAFEPFDDWQAVCPYDGRYLIVALRGERADVYALENGALSLSESIALGGGAAIGCVDSRRAVVCGRAFGAKVLGGDGEDIVECIDCVYADFDGTDIKFSGNMMSFRSEGEVYVVDCTLTDGYEIESGAPYTLGGEICAIDGRLYLVSVTGGICDFEVPSDSGVTSYCRLGEYVVRAHSDGSIDYMPLSGMGTAIASPSFKIGDTIGYTYLSPTATDNGRGVRTVISVEFG